MNKTIKEGGITVDFWTIKIQTFNLNSHLDHTWGSSNSFGSPKTIFPFENTFATDKMAIKCPKLAQLGTWKGGYLRPGQFLDHLTVIKRT